MRLEEILEIAGLKKDEINNVYPYGSRVYGTNTEDSDYDFIIVRKGEAEKSECKTNEINITIYSEKTFIELINEQEISVLECLFLEKENCLLYKKEYSYKEDIPTLRSSISKKSSNSWVKTKKKLIVEKDFDPYIAKKSLFHCFRILDFGIQIATYGRIINYSSMNSLWDEIKTIDSVNWEDYQERFQKRYNDLKSKFKKSAPKEKD